MSTHFPYVLFCVAILIPSTKVAFVDESRSRWLRIFDPKLLHFSVQSSLGFLLKEHWRNRNLNGEGLIFGVDFYCNFPMIVVNQYRGRPLNLGQLAGIQCWPVDAVSVETYGSWCSCSFPISLTGEFTIQGYTQVFDFSRKTDLDASEEGWLKSMWTVPFYIQTVIIAPVFYYLKDILEYMFALLIIPPISKRRTSTYTFRVRSFTLFWYCTSER